MSLLAIRNLKTHLPTEDGIARAVDGVELEVESGESVGLVGESGSGKTLLALSVLGLLPQGGAGAGIQSGSSIRFRGRELVGMDPKELRRVRGGGIAMVFQEPMTSLNPVFSVGSQISETLRVHKGISRAQAREEAVGLMGEVGIADSGTRSRDYPHQLSGGMRQRVMIAMALAGDPDLLIADEPTTALDPTVQAEILRLLAMLQEKREMGVLLISHDLGVVADVCQRVVVMYGGKVVESGASARILRSPSHPYTRGLLASRNPVERQDGRLSFIPGEVPQSTRWPTGCRFHPRCPDVIERCSREAPVRMPVGGGMGEEPGWARCWLLKEAGSGP